MFSCAVLIGIGDSDGDEVINVVLREGVGVGVSASDGVVITQPLNCLLYTSPSPRDRQKYRMPSSA